MTQIPLQTKDTSPRAAGPAGAQFEAKVATHYALAILAQTEAFGLPGAIVDRLEFQRGGQGHPLDDIILKGTTRVGDRCCLEVQAKRSMGFTEKDDNFASIVAGVVEGRKIDPARRFAVAIERTSGPIENGVQEALELSRHSTDAEAFLTLLNTPGRGNNDMRRFVLAFKKHLADNGLTTNDTLFEVLRSFSVLVFDYARPNSIAEHLDRFRAQQLTCKTGQGDPYDALFGLVLRSDAIGGEADRAHLIEGLREQEVEIGGALNLAKARARIEEMSQFALSDIKTTVCGQQLIRADRRRNLEELLIEAETESGIIEITGPGGAGKSGLLKAVAEGRQMSSRILVLSPDRTPSGGWPALRGCFEIDANAEEFIQDLACDGGGLICVDGLDRFRDEGQRKTVIDVVSTALGVKGVIVLFTARSGWEEEASISFGEELMTSFSTRRRLLVEGLDDNEANALAEAAPTLAALLRSDHPAKALTRNPFILRRLVRTHINTDRVLSEAELAWDWWTSGAHAGEMSAGDIHARRRLLLGVIKGLLSGEKLVEVSTQDPTAVATLIADDVLVQISTDRVKFQHDLFTDWAIACALSEDVQSIKSLALDEMPPFWLSRGFELACRRLAEGDDNVAWSNIIKDIESNSTKSGWIGLTLLALIRSEHARSLLERHTNTLLQDEGNLAVKLIRRTIASHSNPIETVLKEGLPAEVSMLKGLVIPDGPQWLPLIGWCAARFDQLSSGVLSATIDLFEGWLTLAALGEKTISPVLLERFADVLVADIEEHDRPMPRSGEPFPKIKYPVSRHARETARLQLALHANMSPNAAERYLSAIARSNHPSRKMRQILGFPGRFASAAPAAFSLAFQGVMKEGMEEDSLLYGRNRRPTSFSQMEGPFALGKCGITLFVDLLDAEYQQGIELVHILVRAVEGTVDSNEGFLLQFAGCERSISSAFSYSWSRGNSPSLMTTRALEALECWGHQRVESGEALDDVIAHIIGDGPISGAILLVVVDLVLSHSALTSELLADLIASPELLALDALRAQYDVADRMSGGALGHSFRSGHPADAILEEKLSSRGSRTLALHGTISQIIFHQSEGATASLRERLASGVAKLGEWTDTVIDLSSPVFMASHALSLSSKENYDLVTEPDGEGGERSGWLFRWPEGQSEWFQKRSTDVTAENESFTRSHAIRMAMNDETKSVSVSVADAETILDETVDVLPHDAEEVVDPNDPWISRVAAAAFVARFGSDEKIEPHHEMLSAVFDQALNQAPREHNYTKDVMFDAHALAIAGILYLTQRFQNVNDRSALLRAVSTNSASAVSAFSRHLKSTESLEDKLLRATIRIGIQACVVSRRKRFEEEEEAFDERQSKLSEKQSARIAEESSWIEHGGDEPAWPFPPARRPRRQKQGITLPGGKPRASRERKHAEWPDYYFDDQVAAVWLRTLSQLSNMDPTVIVELLKANRDWLVDTNSIGEDGEDKEDLERTWSRGLMECAAKHAKSWSEEEKKELIFDVLDEISDEAFIDTAAAFLIQSDLVHIEGGAADTAYLVDIRQKLWARLKETLRWRQHLWSPGGGMEIHLKELIAAFFFKVSYGFGDDTAYTKGLMEDQLTPYLPLLTEIAVASSPCPTIALLYLDVLELIEPKKAEPLLLTAASNWATVGDQRFWNELGIGRRVCAIAEKTEIKSSVPKWMDVADVIAGAGVSAGEALTQAMREHSS